MIGTKIKKAGTLIKPILKGAFIWRYLPVTIKPIVPTTAIKKPIAAEVPIATLIGYPNILRIGVFITPPPIPIGAEKKYFDRECYLFTKYGIIKFHTNHSLKHELIFSIKLNKKNKIFNYNSQKSNEIIKLNKIIKKINNINTKCNILGANLNSAVAINLLKKKIKFIVDENISIKKFHEKKIINIKKHKTLNIPLIIFFGKRNKEIVNKINKKYKLNNIITI